MDSGRWRKKTTIQINRKSDYHTILEQQMDVLRKKSGKGYEEQGDGKQDFEGWKSNSL